MTGITDVNCGKGIRGVAYQWNAQAFQNFGSARQGQDSPGASGNDGDRRTRQLHEVVRDVKGAIAGAAQTADAAGHKETDTSQMSEAKVGRQGGGTSAALKPGGRKICAGWP